MRTSRALAAVLLALSVGSLAACNTPSSTTDSGVTPMGDTGVTPTGDTGVTPTGDTGVTPMGDTGVAPHDGGPSPVDAFVPPTDTGPTTGVPAFRHPLTTDDMTLARQALALMGSTAAGATRSYCNDCHTLSRAGIAHWVALSQAALAPTGCLNDLAVSSDASAMSMTSCMHASGSYTAAPIGVFACGANNAWYHYVFDHAFGATGAAQHADFLTHAGMPQMMASYTPLTQDEFDIIAEWFIRGAPLAETILPADTRPTGCAPGISSAMRTHVTDMATMGWAAQDRADGMLMHSCAGAASPTGCFSTATLASTTTYGAHWDEAADGVSGARIREIFTTTYRSAWWTRASPDGRFVGMGAASAPNLRIVDLQRGVVIGGSADYDTSWFPDGTGFMVQSARTGAHTCIQSVLTNGNPTSLTFNETGCTGGSGVGLYEHIGTSLDGSDYWALSGTATYDDGGHSATLSDPSTSRWDSTAHSTITHFTNTGTSFTSGARMTVNHPYEGDAVMSPSLRVMITRAAGSTGQVGYVVRRLDVSGTTVTAPEIARYCVSGAKPEFSFDERFVVFHHYIGDADAVELGFTGPTDPAFAPFRTQGGANSYILELSTGIVRRLTNVAPGQYALFPHFRADGWIYMMVRTAGATPEHVIVSDAALMFH